MTQVGPFEKNVAEMLLAAEHCLRVRQHVPALVLMYSLVDSLAWVADNDEQPSVRKRFESWVSRWLLPEINAFEPAVSARDVYAARCAVLHTLTGYSHLSKSGQAKLFAYAFGNAKAEVHHWALEDADQKSYLTLHLGDLLTALTRAAERFVSSANHDATLASQIDNAAAKHYVNIDAEIYDPTKGGM